MALPSSIRISGITYDIVDVYGLLDAEKAKKLNGCISYDQSKIEIESSLSDQIKMVTLLHEVIHGILSQAEMEHEEKLISVLGYGVCGFIQDNADFITSIIDHGRDARKENS